MVNFVLSKTHDITLSFLKKQYLNSIYSFNISYWIKSNLFTTTLNDIQYFISARIEALHTKIKQLNIFWSHLVTLNLVFCMKNSTSEYTPTGTSAHSCHIRFVIGLLPTLCVPLPNINNLDWNDFSSSFIILENFSKHSSAFSENEFKISLSNVTWLSTII